MKGFSLDGHMLIKDRHSVFTTKFSAISRSCVFTALNQTFKLHNADRFDGTWRQVSAFPNRVLRPMPITRIPLPNLLWGIHWMNTLEYHRKKGQRKVFGREEVSARIRRWWATQSQIRFYKNRLAVSAMVPCLEQPYAGFRLKLCQIKTPSKKDIRSSQCGISNPNMA